MSQASTVTDRELDAAVAAVRAASALCAGAQGLLSSGDTLTKGDDSPVTVADFAAQAVVCARLTDALGDIAMIGEEDAADLREPINADLLAGVVDLVGAHHGGLSAGGVSAGGVSAQTVLDWISVGSAASSGRGAGDRYWTLDPIDGTKGFLRGDQYAIALALIDDGIVRLGVLGCPNLPNADGSRGAVFAAVDGRCEAWFGSSSDAVPVAVAAPAALSDARLVESVESGHSNQDSSALIAAALGLATEPYRIDSQCKYAAVARGDASIYLRLPTSADYREKIWDHAAGKFVVEQAGGRVTDVAGEPLDFGHGSRLERNRGIVATAGRFHDEVLAAVARVIA